MLHAAMMLALVAASLLSNASTTLGADAGATLTTQVPDAAGATAGALVPIVVPLAFFLLVLALVAVPFYFRARSERLRHDTVRAIVDKGGAIPPELLTPLERPGNGRSPELRRGVLLIALAIGLAAFFLLESRGRGLGIAFVPLGIGLGYLLIWKLERRS